MGMKAVHALRPRAGERGTTLVLIALLLVALLGSAALAIDLGMLYVGRAEAQRAADAAALAGANVFTGNCVVTQSCDSQTTQAQAAQNAVAAAGANYVLGQSATICCDTTAVTGSPCTAATGTNCSGISFTDPSGTGIEPQITVTVQRTAIPLIFAKAIGDYAANVSAAATAEAYASGVQQCVTPFLVPNCDPNIFDYNANAGYNPGDGICSPTDTYAPFVNITGTNPLTSTVVNPQLYSSGGVGVLGEAWTLHASYNQYPVGPDGSVTASQWSMASFTNNNGTSDLVNYIASCTAIGCGDTVGVVTGNRPDAIDSAINQLIEHVTCSGNSNCGNDGPGNGQDSLANMQGTLPNQYPQSFSPTCNPADTFPFTIGNWPQSPNPGGSGCATFGASTSVIIAPIYGGNVLPHGSSQVVVIGFVQLFLDYSQKTNGEEIVQANVLGVQGCTASTGPSSGTFIPIHLIRAPG